MDNKFDIVNILSKKLFTFDKEVINSNQMVLIL